MTSAPSSDRLPAEVKIIETIAVIDDSDHDEFFIRRSLRKAGIAANIIRLTDGQDAINYFSRSGRYSDSLLYPRADLAFLDVNMPGISGFEVLAWLKSNVGTARPFIAMLSSSALSADRQKAFALGADEYLTKPASAAMLQTFIGPHGMEWMSSDQRAPKL